MAHSGQTSGPPGEIQLDFACEARSENLYLKNLVPPSKSTTVVIQPLQILGEGHYAYMAMVMFMHGCCQF